MMPQLITKPLSWFQTNPQVRKQFDEAELLRLGESLKVKQLQPVLCQPDGTIIAGERRLRAATLVGMTHLEAKIADEPLSASEIRVWQLIENMQRADLTGYEQWLGCAELLDMNPGWKQKDLAERLHLSESMIVRLLSPSKCSEQWQEALRDGNVGISDCYAASKFQTAEQAGLLLLKLAGASRDAIEAAGRRSRIGDTPVIRASKIKCPLASGVTVVVSGNDMSLDEVIDALVEASKEARKARDQGLHAKTFEASMRDRHRREA
ncbi:MAG: ParB/RepB/Spo0J family partition protein [Planctomycetaceae bacterium]|nr:ParB/RepB/Spo0J family partition protein [Planctomycetaceae bacterium]